MAALGTKISFTIRRPVPVSLAESSGDESDGTSHNVTSLNEWSRCVNSPLTSSSLGADSQLTAAPFHTFFSSLDDTQKTKTEPQAPLVIPALRNRDWRDLARKRLQATKRMKVEMDVDVLKAEDATETEDQRAIRALLASANDPLDDGPQIDIMPIPITETDAYRQDVQDLPREATLDDYSRVPVSQFGEALLRGMGWKPGMAASRTRKGLVEPYMPESRPSLLGIGAKEREVVDDGSKQRKNKKPERRYVPVIKKERESVSTEPLRDDDRERSGSGTNSRRRSRSPRRTESRRTSPPTSRRSSRSPPRRDLERERERDYGGSRRDSRREYEDRSRGDGRKSYVGTPDRDNNDEKERRQSPGTNGDSNGRRRRD